jgi:hypothetical protein
VRITFWLGNHKERGHLEALGVVGKIILELMVGLCGEKVWTGYI